MESPWAITVDSKATSGTMWFINFNHYFLKVLTGADFTASYTSGVIIQVTQTIAGTFDTSTTFTGTYSLFPVTGFPACETPRGVEGVKL